jgi:lipopolysaccharide export system permease protein
VEYTGDARPYNPVERLYFHLWYDSSVPFVKIINRYVLKEHVGPFVFSLSALTSLLLLQYIARRFGDLVGKGLSWQVITEFLLLSVPFTVAMTLPMTVLVSVLYAFSRLASENEITALKAGGVSTRRLMLPALLASIVLAMAMLAFNDQVLPRANHRLATLQASIIRTKPTFALREQVINAVKEGQLYIKAARIDEGTSTMRDVVIYDLSDASRRRTIYADSGVLSFASNRQDLLMHLYTGMMLSAGTNQPGQVNRVFYDQEILKIRDVANQFKSSDGDAGTKGEREMSICEMQAEYVKSSVRLQIAEDALQTERKQHSPQAEITQAAPMTKAPEAAALRRPRGIGAVYCSMLEYALPRTLAAQEVGGESARAVQAAAQQPAAQSPTPQSPVVQQPPQSPVVQQPPRSPVVQQPAQSPVVRQPPRSPGRSDEQTARAQRAADVSLAQMQRDEARRLRNRYAVEIQKKFSLAAACIVFVLVGAPIALRFPRGGVGLVIAVSFVVFAIYYIGLIGGESLANKSIISPFWAMWGANVIFLLAGLVLIARTGRESVTNRGGDFGEMLDAARTWIARRGRRVGLDLDRRSHR